MRLGENPWPEPRPRPIISPADGPDEALAADRVREEPAAGRLRPEWIWFAEDEGGEVLARAPWWGGEDSEHPIALDCLQVRAAVTDPAAVAAGLPTGAPAASPPRRTP